MKSQVLSVLCCAVLVLVNGIPTKEKKAVKDKKHKKRGLYDLGYEHNSGLSDIGAGHDNIAFGGNLGLAHNDLHFEHGGWDSGLNDLNSLQNLHANDHVKSIIIRNKIKVPVPHPVPVTVEKKVPYAIPVKVPVPIETPYPVHVTKFYPVPVDKLVPYPVEKPVPYLVKVPFKVPVVHKVAVPILKPMPYPVHKNFFYPVKIPVYVKKKVPYFIYKDQHDEGFEDVEFGDDYKSFEGLDEHSDLPAGLDDFY